MPLEGSKASIATCLALVDECLILETQRREFKLKNRENYVDLWKAIMSAHPDWDNVRGWAAVYRIIEEGEFSESRLP